MEKNWIKSSITFDQTTANVLNTIKIHLESSNKERINYYIMRLCLYIGISLNAEERRKLIEVKRKVENSSFANKAYSVPTAILLSHELELKMMLFAVTIKEMNNDIDVKLLQERWNNSSLKREEEYVHKFYEYIESGALFVYKLFEIDGYSPLKSNELIFEILCGQSKEVNEHAIEEDEFDMFTYKG